MEVDFLPVEDPGLSSGGVGKIWVRVELNWKQKARVR
jgi:hypothetical protein